MLPEDEINDILNRLSNSIVLEPEYSSRVARDILGYVLTGNREYISDLVSFEGFLRSKAPYSYPEEQYRIADVILTIDRFLDFIQKYRISTTIY